MGGTMYRNTDRDWKPNTNLRNQGQDKLCVAESSLIKSCFSSKNNTWKGIIELSSCNSWVNETMLSLTCAKKKDFNKGYKRKIK